VEADPALSRSVCAAVSAASLLFIALPLGCSVDETDVQCPSSVAYDVVEQTAAACSPWRASRTDLWTQEPNPANGRLVLEGLWPGAAAPLVPDLRTSGKMSPQNASVQRVWPDGFQLVRTAAGEPAWVVIPLDRTPPRGAALEFRAILKPAHAASQSGRMYWLPQPALDRGEWFSEERALPLRFRASTTWQWVRTPLPNLGEHPLRALRLDLPPGANSMLVRSLAWSTSPTPLGVESVTPDSELVGHRADGALRPGFALAGAADLGLRLEGHQLPQRPVLEFEWTGLVTRPALEPIRMNVTLNDRLLLARTIEPTSEPQWVAERVEIKAPGGDFALRWTVTGSDLHVPTVLIGAPRVTETVERAPAVILVTLDTTRADRVSLYEPGLGTTPGLERAAASSTSVRYWNHRSQSNVTTPSHASLLTGLYPPAVGVLGNTAWEGIGPTLRDPYTTLAEVYRASGYDTAAFVSAFPVSAELGFAQGFDVFDAPAGDASRTAIETVSRARSWLRKHTGRPIFLWLHLYDPHAPYDDAPEEFRRRFAPQQAAGAQRAPHEQRMLEYDAEIFYSDLAMDAFHAELEAGWSQAETLYAFTSDHGESIGEQGLLSSHFGLSDINLRVPLLIRYPASAAPHGQRDVRSPTENVDLAVTLLGTSGLPAPEGLPGRDLRDPIEDDRPTFAWWQSAASVTKGALRLVRRDQEHKVGERGKTTATRAPGIELYHLGEDPEETNDLAADDPSEMTPLVELLERTEAQWGQQIWDSTPTSPLGREQLDLLEALGYTVPTENLQ